MRLIRHNFYLLIAFLISSLYAQSLAAQDSIIELNDNLVSAGTQGDNEFTINLVAEEGMWYPGGPDKPGAIMQAFREENNALLIPAPLLRIKEGSQVTATIRNAIPDLDLRFHGFQNRTEIPSEPTVIPSGETRTLSFAADKSGVYYYWGSTISHTLEDRRGSDAYLTGALVIDPADSIIEGRIFILGEGSSVPGKREHAINGGSFPNTEKLQVNVGETNRWIFINPSFAPHPLHLHGSHFQVTMRGDMLANNSIPEALVSDIVTGSVPVGGVMALEWEAHRPGNWLFHCHISAHVAADSGRLSSGEDFTVSDEAPGLHEMAGMTMAIEASANPAISSDVIETAERKLTMLLETQNQYFGDNTGIAISFNDQGSNLNTPVAPGPTVVLEKDQTTSITINNELAQTTAIHWHGMELESYYDGVAGFSGDGSSVTPALLPGESFTAKMAPPRAGTYFYHTHMDDRSQLVEGLYGALIVNSPDYPYDPAIDKIFVVGMAGDATRRGARVEGAVINGTENYSADLEGQDFYRIRLINITSNNDEFQVSLNSASGPESWTPIAKDGAELPAGLQTPVQAADISIPVGQAFDFFWKPNNTGVYWLEIRRSNGEWISQAQLNVIL